MNIDNYDHNSPHLIVGITDMNDRSSRSHTIFRIIIESLEVSTDDEIDETGRAVKVNNKVLVISTMGLSNTN